MGSTSAKLALLLALVLPSTVAATEDGLWIDPGDPSTVFDCAYRSARDVLEAFRAAVERGDLPDPRDREIPVVAEGLSRFRSGGPRSLTTDDIYPYEDTDQLLLTDWTLEQLLDFMVTAANDLLSVHGDNYDFVGFWLNFVPHHQYGGAFCWLQENDVTGIGKDVFNHRFEYGVAGENIEGMLMMYNVHSSWFDPPGGPQSDFTQLGISHEFEHRWAMNLPPLADGRSIQGEADPLVGGPCGKTLHWSYKVDGQGSCMEIREWIGLRPARLQPGIFAFCADIPGGVFSYPDLYLMGVVSPEEMDAGVSELRFTDMTVNCADYYQGTFSHFTAADIIETAGPRVPDAQNSQKDWHTGWIMVHLPGDPPDPADLEEAIAILEEHQTNWSIGTLGRGTMDHSLYDPTTDTAGSISDDPGTSGITIEIPSPSSLGSPTSVRYTLDKTTAVTLEIHDVTGRRVAELVRGTRYSGSHSAVWDGKDERGVRVGSGVYFALLSAGNTRKTAKFLVVK